MTDSTFISRVVLKNYKSIAACDVRLGPLTFLVGPNGSGKSNFLDALRFVSDALSTSLDHAIRERGGINEVRRRSGERPASFGIRLEFRAPNGWTGHYAFSVGALKRGGFEVIDEECTLDSPVHLRDRLDPLSQHLRFRVHDGQIKGQGLPLGPAPRDRLYLPIAVNRYYWTISRLLGSMGFYNFHPETMRLPADSDGGLVLVRDGVNIATVLGRLIEDHPDVAKRINEYLAQVVPDVGRVITTTVDELERLEFEQYISGEKDVRRFSARSMSDGTLRALGVFVALLQLPPTDNDEEAMGVPLVGIEEPEAALHPAGAEVLFDALRDASHRRQVVVTSHSADLLDNKEVDADSILAVMAEAGETYIGPIEDVGRSVLRDRLYSVGELLRMDQLRPATSNGAASHSAQLFSDGAA